MRAAVFATLGAAVCAAAVSARGRAQVPGGGARGTSPWLARAVAVVRYPEILRSTHAGGTVAAAFTVGAAGRVDMGTVRIAGDDASGVFGAAIRAALRSWHFTPARLGGRAVPAAVTVRVRFTPVPDAWRPTHRVCMDCDPELYAAGERLDVVAEQHADCARALREIGRVNPTDTLAWAGVVAPWCDGASEAAAFAVRAMNAGFEPDSVQGVRARLAAEVATADAFEAALAVARTGYPQVRRHALQILDGLGEGAPHALETADAASGCGAFVIDPTPGPSVEVRGAYRGLARALAAEMAADATLAPPLRAAAGCVRDDLSPRDPRR